MKRRDLEKLRKHDPGLAGQLERVLEKREAAQAAEETPPAPKVELEPRTQPGGCGGSCERRGAGDGPPSPAHSCCAAPAAAGSAEEPPELTPPPEAPAEPQATDEDACEAPPYTFTPEGYQEPLLEPEAYEVDDQTLLFCGGSVAELEDDAEDAEEPKATGETDALLAELQEALPFKTGKPGEENLPACKRSAESQALPTWQERSTRREGDAFEHPPEQADVRGLSDAALGERWGWLSKHRGRGLSARDEAVQREVYARCLGVPDLYGLDWNQAGSAYLRETLRKLGSRSEVARTIVALFELMASRGRIALRLSAPDARMLFGWSLSTWWAAVARLEDLGMLCRVKSIKACEHGASPVQADTNLYVLGPWWFASAGKDPTPLQTVLGLFAQRETRQPSAEAARAHHRLLLQRKERRRENNTVNRDRNRRRHHDLPAKATTTKTVLREAEAIAKRRQALEEKRSQGRDQARAKAMLRGESFGLGESRPALPPVPTEPSAAAEAAAQAHVSLRNSGLRAAGQQLHRESRVLCAGLLDSQFELPSGFRSAIPKGKNAGKNSIADEPRPKPKPASPRPEARPPDAPEALPRTKAGDRSGQDEPLRVRTQALEGKVRTRRLPSVAKTPRTTLPEQLRAMYSMLYGGRMPE